MESVPKERRPTKQAGHFIILSGLVIALGVKQVFYHSAASRNFGRL